MSANKGFVFYTKGWEKYMRGFESTSNAPSVSIETENFQILFIPISHSTDEQKFIIVNYQRAAADWHRKFWAWKKDIFSIVGLFVKRYSQFPLNYTW